MFHTSDRPSPLHRREWLTEYLTTPLPNLDQLKATSHDRAAYDRARILHFSGNVVLNTPHVMQAKLLLEQCFWENLGRNSGHSGLMLDGAPNQGKTTTAKALMRWTHAKYRQMDPDYLEHGRVPVVYVEVPAGSTGKLLMRQFADFFGLSVRSGESMVSIRSRVADTLRRAATQLIVVDELHNLASKTAGNGESVDVLKGLHNDVAATFLYAGINLTQGNLLSGDRGQQLASRFTRLELEQLNMSDPKDKKTWNATLRGFEQHLTLLDDFEVGSIEALSDYLWQRTTGSIGALSRLLTGAAIDAIRLRSEDRPERIDKALLDKRVLGHTAETRRKLLEAGVKPRLAVNAGNLITDFS